MDGNATFTIVLSRTIMMSPRPKYVKREPAAATSRGHACTLPASRLRASPFSETSHSLGTRNGKRNALVQLKAETGKPLADGPVEDLVVLLVRLLVEGGREVVRSSTSSSVPVSTRSR